MMIDPTFFDSSRYLYENKITALPDGLFRYCSELSYMFAFASMSLVSYCFSDLNDNMITSIPTGFFDETPNLDTLFVFKVL
jgi:hypothetical protein